MTQSKGGFAIRFASARALKKEYDVSLSRGGMLVPWSGPPAPLNTLITLRVEAPNGTRFDLDARVGQPIPGIGFTVSLVSFETQAARRAPIDDFMRGSAMSEAIAAEPPSAARQAPEVRPLESIELEAFPMDKTDPGLELPSAMVAFTSTTNESEAVAALELEPETTEATVTSHAPKSEEDSVEVVAAEGPAPFGLKKPGPGEEYLVYVVKYSTVRDFQALRDHFRATQRLELNQTEDPAQAGKIVELRLTLPGHNIFKMFGVVEHVNEGRVTLAFDENNEEFRKACVFVETPAARSRLRSEQDSDRGPPSIIRLMDKVPDEDPSQLPIRRRLQRMGMDDKINLALSGNREERMALAMDGNKAIHHFLLRNAKISLDEIAFMARLPSLNPDVLDKIAENPAYTQNPTVVKALVYNPKTPVLTAIRLLDRLPRPEIMNLAKRVNMNQRLIIAAKKKIEGSKI